VDESGITEYSVLAWFAQDAYDVAMTNPFTYKWDPESQDPPLTETTEMKIGPPE
jgi:hypothetical protein